MEFLGQLGRNWFWRCVGCHAEYFTAGDRPECCGY